MKGFYMLGSDYPVQLWMRPIARPKAREGSWETSHDIGQSVIKGTIDCLSWGFIRGPQAASCSGCCLAVKPSCTLRKGTTAGREFFSLTSACAWLTQSGNALKSVHSHQGTVETFLTNASMVCRLEHMYYMAPGVTSPVQAPSGRTLKTIPLWDSC